MSGFDVRSLVNQYKFSCTLPGSGQVIEFKPMTTGQMKYLLTHDGVDTASVVENAIDDIIRSCVVTENFDVEDLYIQDRFFLLVEIRKKTKGAVYTFSYKCPVCDVDNIVSISLDEMTVRPIKEVSTIIDINEQLKCRIVMPKRRNYKKALSMFKAGDENSVLASYELGINVITECIDKFISDGQEYDVEYEDKVFVIENTPDSFLSSIKSWQEENDFGLDFTYSYMCGCGFKRTTEVPVTNFFT